MPVLGGLVDEGRMALAEGAARGILARQADRMPFDQQRAEGQRLARGPVEAAPGLEHGALAVQQAAHRPVQVEALGHAGQGRAHLRHRLGRDAGLAGVIFGPFGLEARPLAVQPVGLVRLEGLAQLELLVERRLEGGLHVLDLALGDQAVLDQPLGVQLQRRLVALDVLVHRRVGEHRLVAFVVTEAAIAEDVDDHVLVELLAELGRDLGGMDHGLGVVAVHVEDRRLDHQGDVGRIGRGPAEMRGRGEADLVVDDDVDRPARAVAADARQLQAFRHHALAREGRVAVQQHGDGRGAVGVVVILVLLGADLAQHHRVHRFQVRGVRRQRQVDAVAVELAVRRGAEVVFHVARAVHVLGLVAAALEFVEDRAEGLAHHVGQHRQAAPVGHPDDDLFRAQRAAALDDLLHRRDQRLAAVKAEALGPHVFHMEELLEALGLDQLVQDRLAAFLGEADLLAVAFDPLLQPGCLLGVRDVHELQREGAAIGALHQLDDLADRGDLQAQHVVDEDRPVHVRGVEAVGRGVKLAQGRHLAHPQRVEIREQVAPDPVGADQHDRADAVENRAAQLFLGRGDALFIGLFGDLLDRLLGDRLGRHRPLAGQRGGVFIRRHRRPVGPRPARPRRLARDGRLLVAQTPEELVPGGIDRRRIVRPLAVELLDISRVRALQEGAVAEGVVGGLVVHWVTSSEEVGRKPG